jgi:hypothetical protein
MIIERQGSKIALLILGSILLFCSTSKEEDVTFKLEHQKLLSKEFEIKLPISFRIQKEYSEGGVIYYYSYPDFSYVIISQGASVNFPEDKYKPEKTLVIDQRKISFGKHDNKFWRKDVIDDVRVYYGDVLPKNKAIYNNILDSIKISDIVSISD